MDSVVSVIIPCYKQARYLRECIASLQRQTWPNWEAIIIDDGSPDDALAIGRALAAEESRVRVVAQPNAGPAAARNTGMRLTRGEYVQFLDADDVLVPTKLEEHIGHLVAHPAVDLVYGNAWYFPDGHPERKMRSGFGLDPNEDWIAASALRPEPILQKLIEHNHLPICCPLFRRRVADRVGHMDESMRTLEDWEFWLRIAAAGFDMQFLSTSRGESYIRTHATSASADRPSMLDAELPMRVRCMSYLRGLNERRQMLGKIGQAIQRLDPARRSVALRGLAAQVRGRDEILAWWVARISGGGARSTPLLGPMLRYLPWRLRLLAAP